MRDHHLVVPDETKVEDLLKLAATGLNYQHVEHDSAEAVGKREWDEILAPYIACLVRDHWCRTCGDLRMLLCSGTGDWEQLALPLRLKLEIEIILMPCSDSRDISPAVVGHLNKIQSAAAEKQQETLLSMQADKQTVRQTDKQIDKQIDKQAENPLPPGWEEKWDEYEQSHYFYNRQTGASSWYMPTAPPSSLGQALVLDAEQESPKPASAKAASSKPASPKPASPHLASPKAAEVSGDDLEKILEAHKRGGDVSHAISSDSDSDSGQ